MTKKQRKRLKDQTKDGVTNIIDFVQSGKPEGEDFFAFSIVYDDPDIPTHDTRQTCFGSWERCRGVIGSLVNIWADTKPKQTIRILWYQGEGARLYLSESLSQELRFQEQRKNVANN